MKKTLAATIMAISVLGFTACDDSKGNGGNKPAHSSSKTLASYSIVSPAAVGIINESAKTVSVDVPYGTDVTDLVAEFTTTGAATLVDSVEQVSGVTSNDFTGSVVYTVMAEDGSTQDYTVTVTVASESAKEITSFSINGVDATIDGTDISLTLPYGTDATDLVAEFTTTGSSVTVNGVEQESGTTPNDFTDSDTTPVVYVVTAADYSFQEYSVSVTIAANDAKEFTSFSINGVDATIDGTDISLTLPYGTDITALIALFTTTGVSVTVNDTEQESGTTPNDFTGSQTTPVVYVVTAADDSFQEYNATVTVESPRTGRDITAFSINGVGGIISGTGISVSLPMGTDVKHLTADFTLSPGAVASISGVTQASCMTGNNFTNAVTYRVTAEDGSYKDYTVTVTVSAMTGQAWSTIDGGGEYGISSTSSMNSTYPSLAVFGGKLYAAWSELLSSVAQVHIKSYDGSAWANAGNSSGSSQLSTSTTGGYAPYPKLVTYDGALYAAWSELEAGIQTVHVKKYDGSSWSFTEHYASGDTRTNIHYGITANATNPDLAVFNGKLYAAWIEEANGGKDQVRVAEFDGTLWTNIDGNGAYGLNYNTARAASSPVLGVYGSTLYVAWTESDGTGTQLRVKQYAGSSSWSFIDGGGSTGLNYDTSEQVNCPSLAADSEGLYLFWHEYVTAEFLHKVRVKLFNGSSWSAGPDGGGWQRSPNEWGSYDPFTYQFGNVMYASWDDLLEVSGSGIYQIRVVTVNATGKTYIDGNADTGINQTTSRSANYPKLTEYAGNLITAWSEELTDTMGSAMQIRVKKYILPPIVKSVDVPAGGTYGEGDTLTFTVNFSKNVTITSGTPYLPIVLDSGAVNAVYESGSGTSAFVFSYTIVSGDSDTDGITPGSAVAGAVLRSQDTNPLAANYTLYNVDDTTGVLVSAP